MAEARRTWSKPGEEGGRNRTEIYVTTIMRTWRCGPFLPNPQLASNRVPL